MLHAEGAGELLGERGIGIAPRDPIPADRLGAGHVLTRRLIAQVKGVPETVIGFREPLRRPGGRRLLGSDLLVKKLVRRAIAPWQLGGAPPLIVLLIDGNHGPWKERERLLEQVAWPGVAVGVAVREFESWLIADRDNLSRQLRAEINVTGKPEGLEPGVAKERLATLLGLHRPDQDPRLVRRDLAMYCDLELVAKRARSFARFRDSLRNALTQLDL